MRHRSWRRCSGLGGWVFFYSCPPGSQLGGARLPSLNPPYHALGRPQGIPDVLPMALTMNGRSCLSGATDPLDFLNSANKITWPHCSDWRNIASRRRGAISQKRLMLAASGPEQEATLASGNFFVTPCNNFLTFRPLPRIRCCP